MIEFMFKDFMSKSVVKLKEAKQKYQINLSEQF